MPKNTFRDEVNTGSNFIRSTSLVLPHMRLNRPLLFAILLHVSVAKPKMHRFPRAIARLVSPHR